jgi:hypothetical protein
MAERLVNQQADGGSNPTPSLQSLCRYDVREISRQQMQEFVNKWHYSCVMPRQTKLYLGGVRQDDISGDIKAAISFGWGSRPLHTIRKLFPSLTTKDYLDIGKMCMEDNEPKNSESMFLAQAIKILKKKHPEIKLLFTWADGMWGKPGYIYQASNFLYGGYIWTDVYMTPEGKRLHPLQLQAERRARGAEIIARTQRPSLELQREMGWKHYFGKQFRYIRFLCSDTEKKRLLKESTETWTTNYPKDKDCEWKVQTENGRILCPKPDFTAAIKFKKREENNQ